MSSVETQFDHERHNSRVPLPRLAHGVRTHEDAERVVRHLRDMLESLLTCRNPWYFDLKRAMLTKEDLSGLLELVAELGGSKRPVWKASQHLNVHRQLKELLSDQAATVKTQQVASLTARRALGTLFRRQLPAGWITDCREAGAACIELPVSVVNERIVAEIMSAGMKFALAQAGSYWLPMSEAEQEKRKQAGALWIGTDAWWG